MSNHRVRFSLPPSNQKTEHCLMFIDFFFYQTQCALWTKAVVNRYIFVLFTLWFITNLFLTWISSTSFTSHLSVSKNCVFFFHLEENHQDICMSTSVSDLTLFSEQQHFHLNYIQTQFHRRGLIIVLLLVWNQD